MKKTIYSLSLLLCLSLCVSSCGDDKNYTDEEMLEKVHSHGHDVSFNGIIDGVYCKASADGTVVRSSRELGADGEIYKYDGNSLSYAYASISKIPYGKGDSLCIKLWPVKNGVWNIARQDVPGNKTRSSVWITRGSTVYAPCEGRGELSLSVNKVLMSGLETVPRVFGDIYGTLYNTRDPNDSIVLEKIEFHL